MNGETDKSLEEVRKLLSACVDEVSKRVVGQQPMIMGILMAVIADGHVLLEGVPGLAKTLVVKTVAEVIGGQFKRIQFTPDLLPADIIGTMIYRQQTGEFVPRRGPIFSNVILADEINRAPAKVQSALLEAMQERQVTIGDSTYPLDRPFLVLATQNPIEHEGTYALPEAQLDRFIMKIRVTYPSLQEEIEILRLVGVERIVPVERVLSREQLFDLREAASRVRVDSRIEEYIVSLVAASREKERSKADFIRFIEYGASPRASIYLYRCAKIRALFEGRSFIVPEDVKAVAPDVMRHRIILTYEAESEELTTDDILSEILAFVRVP
ncbi:MAG TPA: AAA family ATPase [Spirochaetia bacterium]|nr:AAA family ATPase [Spirochaetia bacterium]